MRAASHPDERPGDGDGDTAAEWVEPELDVGGQRPVRRAAGARHRRSVGRGGRHGRRRARNERASLARELPLLIGIALVLALLIKTFLVQAFYIPSDSMENTLQVGDRVLVNKLGQRFGDVERGEVVVFRDPGGWLGVTDDGSSDNALVRGIKNVLVFVGLLPSDSEQDLIKRVVGLPGDRVACCDAEGRVTVNDVPLDETHVYPGDAPSDSTFDVVVPVGRLFVMGDHRSVSADSRAHLSEPGQGTIPEGNVVGRAFVIVWPIGRIGGLPVPDAFAQPALNAVAGTVDAAPVVLSLALAMPLTRGLAGHRRRRR